MMSPPDPATRVIVTPDGRLATPIPAVQRQPRTSSGPDHLLRTPLGGLIVTAFWLAVVALSVLGVIPVPLLWAWDLIPMCLIGYANRSDGRAWLSGWTAAAFLLPVPVYFAWTLSQPSD
jgi:hypothetical protein